MSVADVLTNEFRLKYDEIRKELLILPLYSGKPTDNPIRHTLDMLVGMGPEKASRWVGETILLLVPEMRRDLFKLGDETSE